MRRAVGVLAAAVVTAALGVAPAQALLRNVGVSGAVPPVTVTTERGARLTLPEPGRAAILFFWRPGQRLCEAALGDLVALAPALAKLGVAVVAIAERGSDRVPAGVPFDVVLDRDGAAADALGVVVYPTTVIVTTERRLQGDVPLHTGRYRDIVEAHARRAAGGLTESALTARLAELGVRHGHDAEAAHEAYRRGVTAVGERRFADAVGALEQALALRPDDGDARLRLGWVWLELGAADRALAAFDAVAAATGQPGARLGAGIARVRGGRVDEGVRMIEDALALNPEPVRGHYELGRAFEARGDPARALAHYRAALDKLREGRR